MAYEKMRRMALTEAYRAVWVVEADTIPPEDALTKLLEIPADMVTGLYVQRHGSPTPNLFRLNQSPDSGSGMDWAELKRSPEPVIQVAGGCMGCVLIRPVALDFSFEIGGTKAPDMQWMAHNWKLGRTTAARLDVQCGHKQADGTILLPKDYL